MLCIKKNFILSLFITLFVVSGTNVHAQGFGTDDFGDSTTFKDNEKSSKNSKVNNPNQNLGKNNVGNDNKFFVPEKDKPKSQANPRQQVKPVQPQDRGRTTAIQRIYKKGEKPDPKEDVSLIFLMSDQFKISRSMGGRVSCSLRFIVLSNVKEKLSNLSVKLKWPKISTTLVFSDVVPNVATSFNYTLIGDGCYSMDKVPNIIVNRCRVKGLSQTQCAQKIRWLKQ